MNYRQNNMNQAAGYFCKFLVTVIFFTGLSPQQLKAQHDPVPVFQGKIGKTLGDSKQWWEDRVAAPAGAPNVLWILIDDVGFGASSAFGGLIETPTFEKLADNGLRYTNFHTTSLCSPTRAALLTGRNAHSVAVGHHPELAIGEPGYSGDIPFEAGTVAEIFKENGYNTFALGKWHSTSPRDFSAAGPYNRWPTGRGFEHFYGFMGGNTDQWHPQLIEENNPVDIEPNAKPLNQLLADKAINYIANQKSADPAKPFFMYLAPGATHAPHQVAKIWSDRYKGKFDGGWDAYREQVFKRQLALGLLPAGTILPTRQPGVRAWNLLSVDEKKVYAHFMEVYAGFLSYTDYEVGRVIGYLQQIGQLDNTIIFLMIGDNGASKEGTYTGTTGAAEKSAGEDIKYLLSQYDKIGTDLTSPNYPLGWSQAANTPFRYWKSDANSEGGTHNPLVIYAPKLIKEKGIRFQYGHVIDILPTTLALTGAKIPDTINGYKQRPLQGVSLVYSITDSSAPSRHTTQYYELHGGRAIYKDGWKAEVYHPRNMFNEKDITDINFVPRPFTRDKWELYNINEDWTEINDLAAKYPEKLTALQKLFDTIAIQNNVYPLKSFRDGLPDPVIKPKSVIFEGTSIKTRVEIGKGAVTITANIVVTEDTTSGVIFADGGYAGGSSLYVKDGKIQYTLTDGRDEITLSADKNFSKGAHAVKVEYTSNNTVILSVDDVQLAQQIITRPKQKYLNAFAGEGVSVGRDMNAPVTTRYQGSFPFTEEITSLVIEQTP